MEDYRVIVEGGLSGHFLREGYSDSLEEAREMQARFSRQTGHPALIQERRGHGYYTVENKE